MSFSYPADQQRLVNIFSLPRYELLDSSLLRKLMELVDQFDTDNGTTIADGIVSSMTLLDDPTSGLLVAEAAQQAGVRSLSIKNEYDVTYTAGGQTIGTITKIYTAKQKILRMLDPEGHLAKVQNFNPDPEKRYPEAEGIYGRYYRDYPFTSLNF